ncbi:MAG TPA: glycosyltransferase, partial [Pyrinomonadaceae bacterium]|nr:glycosyltransferase [Pyrinomonadaceae bacterium]
MKPSVLQLVGSFAQGGSERQAVQVSKLLRESGRYEVYLACLDGQGVLRDEAEQIGFTQIPEFPLTKFYDANALSQIIRFSKLLREKKIKVVQTYDFYTNIFGMMGAAIARVPVRIAARRETEGVRTRAQKWAERRAFDLAHVIVVNSEAVRKELIHDGVNKDKIEIIYNGMDTRRVVPGEGAGREKVLAAFGLPQNDQSRFITIVANMRHAMKDQAT